MELFFLKWSNTKQIPGVPEVRVEVVDKATWVRIEREAGFRNTMGQPLEPATASFGGTARGLSVTGWTCRVPTQI